MLLVCILLSPDVAFNSPSPSSAFCYNGLRLLSKWDTQRPTLQRTGSEGNSHWQTEHDCDVHHHCVCSDNRDSVGRQQSTHEEVWVKYKRSSEGLSYCAASWLAAKHLPKKLRSGRLEFEFLPATSLTYTFLRILFFVMGISDGLQ